MSINIGSRAPARRLSAWPRKASSTANANRRSIAQSKRARPRARFRLVALARDLARQRVPRLLGALAEHVHAIAPHIPIDHVAVIDRCARRTRRGGGAGIPGIGYECHANRKRHTENDAEKYTHGNPFRPKQRTRLRFIGS